jgi:hypothetical protein
MIGDGGLSGEATIRLPGSVTVFMWTGHIKRPALMLSACLWVLGKKL